MCSAWGDSWWTRKSHSLIPMSISNVVSGGYCIGCGACAVADNKVRIQDSLVGLPQAVTAQTPSIGDTVCPFSSSENEDTIGALCFADVCLNHHPYVGYYNDLYAGYVAEGAYRRRGGSSGLVTWVLSKLLEEGEIDGVIHVKPNDSATGVEDLFSYGISFTQADIIKAAKAKYYPAHFDEAVRHARTRKGRFAFVGVPCYVKAVRLLMQNDPPLAEKIRFSIALFCGHMKTKQFTAFIADQLGIEAQAIKDIDFRVKRPHQPANRYATKVTAFERGEKREELAPVSSLFGLDWGLGYFKPKACDWCDDIVGELADLSCGDAWLPAYVGDGRGTNLVISRNHTMSRLLKTGMETGNLRFSLVTPEDVYKSQAGNFRHRREGLAERIRIADVRGLWHPLKRGCAATDSITGNRRNIYIYRAWLSRYSQALFRSCGGNSALFALCMLPYQVFYYFLVGNGLKGALKSFMTLGALIWRRALKSAW